MEAQPNKAAAQTAHSSVLGEFIALLTKIVDPLNGIIGATIAATVLAAMMFLTFVDVFGRYILNKPIDGTLEITEFMMGLTVAFALGYCALKKGHIRVDLLMQYTSKKTNQWFDVVTYGVSLIFYVFITWQSWLYAFSERASHLTSAVLLIPVYPFVFAVATAMAFLTLVFLRDFLQSIEEMSK